MPQSWLIEFVALAAKEKWCNKLWCTTCGAMQFRGGLAQRVCERLEFKLPQLAGTTLGSPHPPLLHDLPNDLFLKAVEVVAQELRDVRFGDFLAVCDEQYAEHSVGMILSEIGVMPGQPLIFQSQVAWRIIEGSEVGDYANQWKAYAGQRIEEKSRRDEYESPEATLRRKEERRRARAEAQMARLRQKAVRDRERGEFLDALRAMPVRERLGRLAEGVDPWPLDAIPAAIVQDALTIVDQVPPHLREALARRIGRRRRIWSQLRQRLDNPAT